MDAQGLHQRKKVKPGPLELDKEESSIIVFYETELTTFDDNGDVVDVQLMPSQKRIRIKELTPEHDINAMADELLDKCKLIHPSRKQVVVQLLRELQQNAFEQRRQQAAVEDAKDKEMVRQRRERVAKLVVDAEMERATLRELETYVEKLYDDSIDEKVRGAKMIFALAKQTEHLGHMLTMQEQLFSVLSRTLKDEHRRSIDLCYNIMSIFFCYSNFSDFHEHLSANHVGDMTMRLIEFENKRFQEMKKKVAEAGDDRETILKKSKVLFTKQSRLLFTCFYVLLNLAEDWITERKMKKRKIVELLVNMLDRNNADLLTLVVTFLKKLSIFGENKDEMAKCGIIEKLVRFIPCACQPLLLLVLRLMFNLSFDAELRDQIMKASLIPKLVELLKAPQYRGTVLRLLYHLSMDDRCKSMFSYTDAIPLVVQLVIHFPEQYVGKELIALAVNLSTFPRNAEMICEGDGFTLFVKRLVKTRDPLLCKVLRNISQMEPLKHLFLDFVGDFVHIAKSTDDPDLLVEVLGILGNLTLPELSWADVVSEFNLIEFLHKHLVVGFSEDDIVLECVILIGTLASDERCASLIASSRLIRLLYDLLTEKQEDDEIVLQIVYVFYRLLLLDETKEVVLYQTQVVPYMVELMGDKNLEIRKNADQALDVVMELDEHWRERIRERKYQLYNQQWLQSMEHYDSEEERQHALSMAHSEGYDHTDHGMSSDEEPSHVLHWEDGGDLQDRYWGDMVEEEATDDEHDLHAAHYM
eukprot:GILK01004540.1.p1 GENE.GILK01004540.1~~GILK01004540.1.p1  ORF type:complete len:755 (+),score=181.94 GILK01004540.1:116-2380(+)